MKKFTPMAAEVEIDSPGAVEILREFNRRLTQFPEEFTKTVVAAMNKAAYETEAEAYEILNERYFLDAPNMRERSLKVRRASVKRLMTRLYGSYRPMTLGWWRAGVAELSSDVRGKKKAREPVVKILRSSGARVVSGAFWAKSKRGGTNLIFKRKHSFFSRNAQTLYGPHPLSYLNTSDATARLEDEAVDRIEVYLNEFAAKKLSKLLSGGS